MIFKSEDGKEIGELTKIDDVISLDKRVKKSRHLLKIMDAWGIDFDVIRVCIEKGCQRVRIFDTEEKTLYTIRMNDFVDKAVKRNFGFGEQYFVSRKFFTTTR